MEEGCKNYRETLYSSKLWGNPVIFTNCRKNCMIYSISPNPVKITGFPHNIHNLSLWGVQGFSVIVTAIFIDIAEKTYRNHLWTFGVQKACAMEIFDIVLYLLKFLLHCASCRLSHTSTYLTLLDPGFSRYCNPQGSNWFFSNIWLALNSTTVVLLPVSN